MTASPRSRFLVFAALTRFAGLVPFAALATGQAFAQAEASFGDWVVACDNTRSCRAIGFPELDANYGWLRIDRRPAATAPAAIAVVLNFDSDEKQLPVEARFDEPGFETLFPEKLTIAPDESGRAVIAIPVASHANFIAALKKAGKLTIRRLDPKARPDGARAVISLKGSIAALRWLDDQQKRAGTVTALVATGNAAAATIPRPPAEPAIRRSPFMPKDLGSKAPPAIIAAWKEACDEWDDRKPEELSGHQIAEATQIWQAPCSRGAYNFGSMFFMLDQAGRAEQLQFEQWKTPADGKPGRFVRDAEELINASFESKTRTITYFSKGRGIGDCGASATFVWDGARFRVSEYSAMGQCKGVTSQDWPAIWRARVSP